MKREFRFLLRNPSRKGIRSQQRSASYPVFGIGSRPMADGAKIKAEDAISKRTDFLIRQNCRIGKRSPTEDLRLYRGAVYPRYDRDRLLLHSSRNCEGGTPLAARKRR